MNVSIAGLEVHCEVEGEGPWLVLSHSLGCDLRMWDAQVAHFRRAFRVLRYDIRGHGRSAAGALPPEIDHLGVDLLGLMAHFGIEQADIVGLSLGGLVAQALALAQPACVRSLTLADTTSCYPPAARTMWLERIRTAASLGLAPLCEPTLQRWFTPRFMERHPERVALAREMIMQTSAEGYAHCCGALSRADTQALLGGIACPTLVLVGEHDQGTPLPMAQALHAGIRGSVLQTVADAAHLSSFEQPDAFNRLLDDFLESRPL